MKRSSVEGYRVSTVAKPFSPGATSVGSAKLANVEQGSAMVNVDTVWEIITNYYCLYFTAAVNSVDTKRRIQRLARL